jgi:hypothetical protein
VCFPNLRSGDITSTRKWQPLAQLRDPLLPFFSKMDVTLWSTEVTFLVREGRSYSVSLRFTSEEEAYLQENNLYLKSKQ